MGGDRWVGTGGWGGGDGWVGRWGRVGGEVGTGGWGGGDGWAENGRRKEGGSGEGGGGESEPLQCEVKMSVNFHLLVNVSSELIKTIVGTFTLYMPTFTVTLCKQTNK